MKPVSFQTLPFELRRSVLTFHSRTAVRHYAAPARAVKSKAVVYRGRTVASKDEGPSPLSPFSRVKLWETGKPAVQASANEGLQLARKNANSPRYNTSPSNGRNKKPKIQPAKQSRTVAGTSPTRKLLITPAIDRVSRIPVWARPPTAESKSGPITQPPTGTSWAEHRVNIKAKYPDRWDPQKKVSREAMDAIRELNKQDPDKYPIWVLAQRFTINQDAVRRILKSKWRMSEDKVEEKIMKQRMRRIEMMKRMKEEEMHQMVRAGIQLKVHPDDQLRLK